MASRERQRIARQHPLPTTCVASSQPPPVSLCMPQNMIRRRAACSESRTPPPPALKTQVKRAQPATPSTHAAPTGKCERLD
ncbi:hypothetical protein EJ06DRAFT_12238 [Trichodelitschia bisporula]|uniref:Uncharacterized protein n=1 Tax=Trichodelitschia bisporula TaxID=703511 RepID=A0A6G1IA79_9PEZI|nr:hypothetical protein EJ06DRAFT_12238 [Trichodelitschia bisporula]